MTYTVFVGSWDDGDPDYTHHRISGLTWEAAREKLAERLAIFKDDICESCRADAAEATARLQTADPGSFHDCIDGDDYMIIPEAA